MVAGRGGWMMSDTCLRLGERSSSCGEAFGQTIVCCLGDGDLALLWVGARGFHKGQRLAFSVLIAQRGLDTRLGVGRLARVVLCGLKIPHSPQPSVRMTACFGVSSLWFVWHGIDIDHGVHSPRCFAIKCI
jgi:hypothetical protein